MPAPRAEPQLTRAVDRARLAGRVLWSYAIVRPQISWRPTPDLVQRLSRPARRPVRRDPPPRLSRAVDRTLRLGRLRPRCLVNALVLYRLLRLADEPARLVIGLPTAADGERAHAWVELHGRDVGPPPGRSGHVAMAVFDERGAVPPGNEGAHAR